VGRHQRPKCPPPVIHGVVGHSPQWPINQVLDQTIIDAQRRAVVRGGLWASVYGPSRTRHSTQQTLAWSACDDFELFGSSQATTFFTGLHRVCWCAPLSLQQANKALYTLARSRLFKAPFTITRGGGVCIVAYSDKRTGCRAIVIRDNFNM